MRVEFKSSFLKEFRHFDENTQREIHQAVQQLIQLFETGEKTHGLGLKQLRKPYWEIRVGLRLRIVFRLEGDLLKFVMTGNHDEIRRFLKPN